MENSKQDIINLINDLPVQDSVKQELLGKLEKDGPEAVKEDIKAILTMAAGNLSEQDMASLEAGAQQEFEAELQRIEAEAKQLANAVTKNQDSKDLASVREQLNQ